MASSIQLLGSRQTGRTRAHDGYFLSGAEFGRIRTDQTFFPSTLHDAFLNLLDRDRRRVDAEYTSCFTWRGTDSAGEFGKVVRRVKLAQRLFPTAAINQVVPVGNEVVNRASGVTEGHAAIHAAGALHAQL